MEASVGGSSDVGWWLFGVVAALSLGSAGYLAVQEWSDRRERTAVLGEATTGKNSLAPPIEAMENYARKRREVRKACVRRGHLPNTDSGEEANDDDDDDDEEEEQQQEQEKHALPDPVEPPPRRSHSPRSPPCAPSDSWQRQLLTVDERKSLKVLLLRRALANAPRWVCLSSEYGSKYRLYRHGLLDEHVWLLYQAAQADLNAELEFIKREAECLEANWGEKVLRDAILLYRLQEAQKARTPTPQEDGGSGVDEGASPLSPPPRPGGKGAPGGSKTELKQTRCSTSENAKRKPPGRRGNGETQQQR